MNIIVTGCSKGIGKALVKYLNENPEHTIFALSRDKKLIEEVRQECPHPKQVHFFELDLNREDYPPNFVKAIKDTKQIDILINNAGTLIHKDFLHLSQQDWQSVFQTNVFSAVRLIQYLHPKLKASPFAHIVNIGSMGGVENSIKFNGLSAYSASKAALANITQCLAEEFKEDGIHCNCLSLGAVNTEMLQQAFPQYTAPLNANEMASFIGDFALKSGKYMNGKILQVSSTTP